MNADGDFAIVTGALSAANQNAWIAAIKPRLSSNYPTMRLVTIRPSDDDRERRSRRPRRFSGSIPA